MFKSDKKVYCSAGINHFLVYPNGDVYRCMADYNDKRPPLFNVKDGWRPFDAPRLCTHPRCYAACDLDWTTKWVFDEGATVPRTHRAQSRYAHPVKGKFWAEQTLEEPLRNFVYIVWSPSLVCNYDCHYCGCAAGKLKLNEFPSALPELSVEEWVSIWDGILKQYEWGIVAVSGGEPLIAKATMPVVRLLSKKFYVSITSNLSTGVEEIVNSTVYRGDDGELSPGLKVITGSLHPTSRGFQKERFFDSLLYLKGNGFTIKVNFVGHPLQLYNAEEYKRWCDEHGLVFVLSPWCGTDNDGVEAGYTAEEREYFNKLAPPQRKTGTQLEFYRLSYNIETDLLEVRVPENGTAVIKGTITNSSEVTWINNDGSLYLGSRVYLRGGQGTALNERRYPLPAGEIKPSQKVDFKLKIDVTGLRRGDYEIKLDMVREGYFWFEDKGTTPLRGNLLITGP